MIRFLSLGIITLALALPACSSQAPEPEAPPPVAEVMPIPPPPPPFVDVLPEFKKHSRAFLDLAKKLDQAASANPPPPYQEYWKASEPLEELFTKVANNEPKEGAGASAFDRINTIHGSLFQSRLLLKNKDGLKKSQVLGLLEAEADKRKPLFEQAEFYWKDTPEFTKRDD